MDHSIGEKQALGPQTKISRGALIDARDIGVYRSDKWLIRHVDLSVRRGEIVTLIGPNGSGKTTVAKAILGLMAIDEGEISEKPDLKVGYVPQRFDVDPTLPLTVERLMTLTAQFPRDAVYRSLDETGVLHLAGSPVKYLSGGELQRVLLARALVRKPEFLVLDEPVQGVDFSGEIALYDLIRGIRDQLDCGILLISHDLHFVMAETDTVVCLNQHVCCSGTPQSVTADPEYQRLFGTKAAEVLAVYRHDHDHEHGPDGCVIPVGRNKGGEADNA